MSCETDCADKAKADTSDAYEKHAAGQITLEQLKDELERIWVSYLACIDNCLSNP